MASLMKLFESKNQNVVLMMINQFLNALLYCLSRKKKEINIEKTIKLFI